MSRGCIVTVLQKDMQNGVCGILPHHFGGDARIAKDDLHS